MSELAEWLEGRRPAAPGDLRRRVLEALVASGDGDASADDRVGRLLEAARDRLAAARARPGRVRESAFELLAADALVTYACEAALEAERAELALRRLLEVGRTR